MPRHGKWVPISTSAFGAHAAHRHTAARARSPRHDDSEGSERDGAPASNASCGGDCHEQIAQGRSGSPASLGSVHRGLTVLEIPTGGGRYFKYRPPIPSTPGSLWTAGSTTCGSDRAGGGLGRLCQAGVAARELGAASAMAKAGGPGSPHLWSVGDHARGIVGEGHGEPRRRFHREQPSRLARSGLGYRPCGRRLVPCRRRQQPARASYRSKFHGDAAAGSKFVLPNVSFCKPHGQSMIWLLRSC